MTRLLQAQDSVKIHQLISGASRLNLQCPQGGGFVRKLALLMAVVVPALAMLPSVRTTPGIPGTNAAAPAAAPLTASAAEGQHGQREIRLTGNVEAVHSS